MENLESFILRIPDFREKTAAQRIDYFAFYLQRILHKESFTAAEIKECYEHLDLLPYSNISSYLGRNQGRKGKFIKLKAGYILSRDAQEILAKDVSEIIQKPPSSELIDLSIFSSTPYYIQNISKEMVLCYDNGFYNATLVLMRKLLETLIIECFEHYNASEDIKDKNGVFYYLSDLIPLFLKSTHWNMSRNIKNSLEKIKKYGDLSAHNRRFLAKKSDIDSFKFELRQALQEIILAINYIV